MIDKSTRKHLTAKRIIGIISVLVFIALMVWVTIYVGMPIIERFFGSTDAKDANVGIFSDLVKEQPIQGRLIFIAIQILQVFVALIPGEVVEVAAGAVFGPIEGTVLSLLGIAIGSSIIYLLCKKLGLRFVTLFVSEEQINNLKIIRSEKRLNDLVFIVFLIPGTPKDLLTYIIALTRMKLITFLGLSLTARIPSIITSTFAGDAINNGDYRLAIIIFCVTAVLSLIGLLIYNKIVDRRNKKAEAAAVEAEIAATEAEIAAAEEATVEAETEAAEEAADEAPPAEAPAE